MTIGCRIYVVTDCICITNRFATGAEITGHSVLIHDFYNRLEKHVVHVTIDTTLRSGKMDIKAYIK